MEMMMANTHKAWRLHAHNDLRSDEVETASPAPDGVVVRIEAAMVLSYTGKVLSGSVPYSLPPMPFVPGTNAIARVIATGDNVTHVEAGDRVFLSPHLRGDVPEPEPPQILIGLTAMATTPAALALQARWRDGVFAEIAHWPAACATPLSGLDDRPATELVGLAKLIVPFGGLQRSGLRGGDTIIINGATGYFGSGAVMLAVAMGAGRVVAVGRKQTALEGLREVLGPRVIPAVVTGGYRHHPARRCRRRRHRARSARQCQKHLNHAIHLARLEARWPSGADGQRRGTARIVAPRNARQ
jgi:alcohol dehydrogenase